MPSLLTTGRVDAPLPAMPPPAATDTSWVVPVARSWTNTSLTPLPSPGTRSSASLTNAITDGSNAAVVAVDESPAPPTPAGVPLTSSWRHG
ncbi:MAG TPA: hypothetical protein VFH48_09665 [Chloroflexota bacterium]|nr:hypothetical protein [Chloroflexota bacterium]